MKKVLLSSAAILGLASMSTPAAAQVQLELGGFFKGYGAYVDQDEPGTQKSQSVDFVRNTEVHFSGETTLDNGLTVGAHIEAEANGGGDADSTIKNGFYVQESYVYFSGGWGRINAGAEDGAQYLLQVEAPSADGNIDGLRQLINPVNYDVLNAATTTILPTSGILDYSAGATGYNDKLTYLTPILNGFQAGVSYTPDVTGYAVHDGVGFDDVSDAYSDAWEGAVRYEGQFNNVGLTLGGGYTLVNLDLKAAPAANVKTDDRSQWNLGAAVKVGPVGVGVDYIVDDRGEPYLTTGTTGKVDDEEKLVVGVDYTTGPFKIGASYLNVNNTFGRDDLDTDRYAGGVTYTYGPGLTFRGSVGYIDHDATGVGGAGVNDVDATYVTLGTQINF
jgi:outer membrane protein OmpU